MTPFSARPSGPVRQGRADLLLLFLVVLAVKIPQLIVDNIISPASRVVNPNLPLPGHSGRMVSFNFGAIAVHIRKARPADWKACANLDHSNLTDHAWRMQEREREGTITVTFRPIRLPRPVNVPYPRQGDDLVAGWQQCDLFLVAQEGKQTCGYVTARALPGHGLGWVQDLVVDRAWRRQGLGSKLLQEAASWARQQHLWRLIAEIQTNNYPGICFCRSQRLTFCGYHDRHWRTWDIAVLFGQTLR